MGSLDEEQLAQIEELLQSKISILEGRENRLEAQINSLKDRFGRDNIMNQSGLSDTSDVSDTDHIRAINSDRRPQLGSAGLENTNVHLSELSNHELHNVKKMYEKDANNEKKNLLDEPLGEIIDKTINFFSYSFDNYMKSMYTAELNYKKELKDASLFERIYLYFSAFVILLQTEQNMIYMGIILIFLSNIIYFTSILIP